MAKSNNLQAKLILNKYILNQLWFSDFDTIQAKFSEVKEWYDEEWNSYSYYALKSTEELSLDKVKLQKYDENIKEYVSQIWKHRWDNFKLKYFQYFAILLTEIYLDKYFEDRDKLLRELNFFIDNENKDLKDKDRYNHFSLSDLNKLVFWQATGSGKTLIMHINYLQFQKYNKEELEEIILITPNEWLSNQHIKELNESGISAERFNPSLQNTLFTTGKSQIKVLEITKLKEEKSGEWDSIDIESFEGRNLVFIDEWHKWIWGEVWKKLRDKVAENGFTFEYSATFWQALNATKDTSLFEEYQKSILFDYSYRYFHSDNYWKDYSILNLKNEIFEWSKKTYFIANFLLFLQQYLFFKSNPELVKNYNIEKPLLLFIGHSVNKWSNTQDDKISISDVQEILNFLSTIISEKEEIIGLIKDIIFEWKSNLINKNWIDIFQNKFEELKKLDKKSNEIYDTLLKEIFHTKHSLEAKIHIFDMKNGSWELALKIGSWEYFWVINIWDTTAFKKNIEKDDRFVIEQDNFNQSLFERINNQDSDINILIWAKKFTEWWNSYRVSSIWLLNMWKSEWSQIIQLFGRWVRLKGKNHSLKRSNEHRLSYLETLNIFWVKADYMENFKAYLEKEWIDTWFTSYVDIDFPVKNVVDLNENKLLLPKIPKWKEFKSNVNFEFNFNENIKPVETSLITKIDALESNIDDFDIEDSQNKKTLKIDTKISDFFDLDKIYFELISYKKEKWCSNLLLNKLSIKDLLSNNTWYNIIDNRDKIEINHIKKIKEYEDIMIGLLKKYLTKYYKHKEQEWNNEYMQYEFVSENDKNILKKYTIKIKDSEVAIIDEIKKLKKDFEKDELDLSSYSSDGKPYVFPNVYFDKHLYQPLLFQETWDKVKISPVWLNEWEKQFVEDLKRYLDEQSISSDSIIANKKIFILRNLTIWEWWLGFFEAENFSPDFIMWIIDWDKQYISFIDPKWIRNLEQWFSNPKVQFSKKISEIEIKLKNNNVFLNSFILSETEFDKLVWWSRDEKDKLDDLNVIFPSGWWSIAHIAKIFKKILNKN